MKEFYKTEIVKMIKKLNDENFLRYLYKLVQEMIAKSFDKHEE